MEKRTKMNLQKKLQNLGIEQIEKLSNEYVRAIAFNVTEALTSAFPIIYNDYNNIFAQLINCNMYTVRITKQISSVNYIYENNSIYFDRALDLTTVNEQMIHECIHYIQDSRNKHGKLDKIGLCNFGRFSVFGLGINEAAVQYISAKTVENNTTMLEKYGVRVKTISPNYYPLLTNLIEQIVYLIGEDVLVKGILNDGRKLEDELLNTFESNTKRIINQFDIIIDINNKLSTENNPEKIKKQRIILPAVPMPRSAQDSRMRRSGRRKFRHPFSAHGKFPQARGRNPKDGRVEDFRSFARLRYFRLQKRHGKTRGSQCQTVSFQRTIPRSPCRLRRSAWSAYHPD